MTTHNDWFADDEGNLRPDVAQALQRPPELPPARPRAGLFTFSTLRPITVLILELGDGEAEEISIEAGCVPQVHRPRRQGRGQKQQQKCQSRPCSSAFGSFFNLTTGLPG